MARGQQVAISWRLPSLAAALVFVKFAGPICGIMASKVAMYSASPAGITHHSHTDCTATARNELALSSVTGGRTLPLHRVATQVL